MPEEDDFERSLASKDIRAIDRDLESCAGNARLQAKGFEAIATLTT